MYSMDMAEKVGDGVGVFVVRDDKTFLMGKRQNAHGHDSWSVLGGWLEFGETWEDAAKREVLEETGLEIESPVIHVATTNDIFEKENQHSNTIWLKTKYLGGQPEIREPDKCIEQGWFSLDNLPEPLFLPWENLVKLEFDLQV